MLKKRLLPLVLCLALLIPLAACQGGGYKEIEPPVEKLNWGMTQEEAKTTATALPGISHTNRPAWAIPWRG